MQIGDLVTLDQGDAVTIACRLQHIDALDAAILAAGLHRTEGHVYAPDEDE